MRRRIQGTRSAAVSSPAIGRHNQIPAAVSSPVVSSPAIGYAVDQISTAGRRVLVGAALTADRPQAIGYAVDQRMILQILIFVQLLIGLVASVHIIRILQTVERVQCSLLQTQATTVLLANMMIGLNAVIGLAVFFCLLNNTRRNGNANILSEEGEFSSDVRVSELNKCRRRLNKVYNDIGSITVEILTLQYRIDTIFGEVCGIDNSIVHRVLKYFGLA